MENARTFIRQLAKLSLDRLVELAADVHSKVFYKIVKLEPNV